LTSLTTHENTDCVDFIPCSDAPCLNGASCIDITIGELTDDSCDCTDNEDTGLVEYEGEECQTFIPCSTDPCENNSVCSNLEDMSDYSCDCTENADTGFTEYEGKECQTFIPCSIDPCENNSVCSNLEDMSDYSCDCTEDENTGITAYTGNDCQTFVPCSPGPCQNEGTCANSEDFSDYVCTCAVNPLTSLTTHENTDCEDFIPCSDAPCLNGASCIDITIGELTDYSCDCTENEDTSLIEYEGEECQTFIPCSIDPCANGALCSNVDEIDFSCDCVEGFKFETDREDGSLLTDGDGNGFCVVDILFGNPHGGTNCDYFGLDFDQRQHNPPEYFHYDRVNGGSSYSFDDTELAWRLITVDEEYQQVPAGWFSPLFVNREFRVTFEIKVVSADETSFGNFEQCSLKVVGWEFYQWFIDANDNVGTYTSVDLTTFVSPSENGGWTVEIGFNGTADVVFKDFVMSFCD